MRLGIMQASLKPLEHHSSMVSIVPPQLTAMMPREASLSDSWCVFFAVRKGLGQSVGPAFPMQFLAIFVSDFKEFALEFLRIFTNNFKDFALEFLKFFVKNFKEFALEFLQFFTKNFY